MIRELRHLRCCADVENMNTAAASDPDDLFDLSPYGGAWEGVIEHLTDAANAPIVIQWIKTATLPPIPNLDPMMARSSYRVVSHVFQHFQVDQKPRTKLRAGLSMTPTERLNTYWFGQGNAGLHNFVHFAAQSIHAKPEEIVTLRDLEAVAPTLGFAASDLVGSLVLSSRWSRIQAEMAKTIDFDDFVQRHAAAIRQQLAKAVQDHCFFWDAVAKLPESTLELFVGELAAALTSNSKKLRTAALKRAETVRYGALMPELRAIAKTGNPAQRRLAAESLLALAPQKDHQETFRWIIDELTADRSAKVRELVAALSEVPSEGAIEAPPLPEMTIPPISPDSEAAIQRLAKNYHDRAEDFLLVLAGREPTNPYFTGVDAMARGLQAEPKLGQHLTAGHAARLILTRPHMLRYGRGAAELMEKTALVQPLEFHSVAILDGRVEDIAFEAVCSLMTYVPALWPPQVLQEFALYNLARIERYLETPTSSFEFERCSLYALLELLDPLPAATESALVKAAVDGFKADREWSWKMVDVRHADRVTQFLADGKADVRIGAAEWLRAHPTPAAIQPLRMAIRKEKQDKAKAIMLMALEEQGESLEEFLSPDTLLADAQKALAKKNAIPKAMEWLNVDSLPIMTWRDGRPVDPTIIKWFCATAVRNKSAEPSPILRRHLSNMDDAAVRRLGSTLFDLWVNEDLRTVTEEEAQATAEKRASQYLSYAQQHPNQPVWAQYTGQSVEQVAATLIGNYRDRLAGSATSSKGLLAVVAASAGSEVAERAFNYLKTHRGHRLSQGKAVLQMLAWIDTPSTVQVVMAVSTRFRPKGLQQEATKQAELLAARHGWTLDDLADRSVPSGGFAGNGRQLITYGERSFTAHLADDLSVTLVNDQTGKTIRSLPTGKRNEDADLIKDVKKDFAAAKKELKSAAKLQPDRLHLAMCVQRSWTTDDFALYFLQHPVMSRLAARVVWVAHSPDGSMVSFRPLTDGTLLSADDDETELPTGAIITIAHDEVLPAEGSQWVEHFADYEVHPLLAQFGRPNPATVGDQRVVDEFEGHVIDALKLRGQMNRLGWQLGQGQDAGWVYELFKPVPSFDARAVLSITGVNPYPEPHETALLKLYVTPSDSRNSEAEALPLADLPRILVRELYAEVAAIAAAGTGFDPDYRKKTP